jgi:hypothetical protein
MMTIPRHLSALLICIVLLTAAGCTSVQLEYDRMTGTAFPQPETVSGEEVTLTSIYLQGNILLTVVEDTTNIAPLTGPFDPSDPDQYDYITPAELETVELANRSNPVAPTSWSCTFWIFRGICTRYHVYGIVVDHFYESATGSRSTTTMGLMYTSGNRRSFTNFYKHPTNSGDNAKYLRSTAHEIGHTFNLNHCDGDGSTTIMNQTGVVGDTFTYEFSSASLEHLQDHDKDAVWPGIGPRHYACPHVH